MSVKPISAIDNQKLSWIFDCLTSIAPEAKTYEYSGLNFVRFANKFPFPFTSATDFILVKDTEEDIHWGIVKHGERCAAVLYVDGTPHSLPVESTADYAIKLFKHKSLLKNCSAEKINGLTAVIDSIEHTKINTVKVRLWDSNDEEIMSDSIPIQNYSSIVTYFSTMSLYKYFEVQQTRETNTKVNVMLAQKDSSLTLDEMRVLFKRICNGVQLVGRSEKHESIQVASDSYIDAVAKIEQRRLGINV